jgi:hypothetical protein
MLAAQADEEHPDLVGEACFQDIDFIGGPDRIRTCDPQFRKLMLYPAELRDLGRMIF